MVDEQEGDHEVDHETEIGLEQQGNEETASSAKNNSQVKFQVDEDGANVENNQAVVAEEGEEEEGVEDDRKKIFLGGLSLDAKTEDVVNYFSEFGEIVHVRVPAHKTLAGKTRGYGFVSFADAESARNVVATEHKVLGRLVDVKYADYQASNIPPPSSSSSTSSGGRSSHHQTNKSGDSAGIDSTILRVALSSQLNHASTLSEKAGTNTIPSSASSSCNSSVAGREDFQQFKLFVGGLSAGVTDEILKTYFGRFGKVVSSTVMIDRHTNRSRGFGFVIFEDELSMKHTLDAGPHTLLGKKVEIKHAIPRDVLKRQARSASESYAMGGTEPVTYTYSAAHHHHHHHPHPDHQIYGYGAPIYYMYPVPAATQQQHSPLLTASGASSTVSTPTQQRYQPVYIASTIPQAATHYHGYPSAAPGITYVTANEYYSPQPVYVRPQHPQIISPSAEQQQQQSATE